MDHRRVVRVPIIDSMFDAFLKQGTTTDRVIVRKGLPETAKLINWYYEPQTMTHYLYYQDDSFDVVEIGAWAPVFNIILERLP